MKDKPPLGLRPKHIADWHRKREILEAATRYAEHDMLIPKEWLVELMDLNREKIGYKHVATKGN